MTTKKINIEKMITTIHAHSRNFMGCNNKPAKPLRNGMTQERCRCTLLHRKGTRYFTMPAGSRGA
jgi:hypothetical protein